MLRKLIDEIYSLVRYFKRERLGEEVDEKTRRREEALKKLEEIFEERRFLLDYARRDHAATGSHCLPLGLRKHLPH